MIILGQVLYFAPHISLVITKADKQDVNKLLP